MHAPLREKDMVETKVQQKSQSSISGMQQMQEMSSVRLPADVPPLESMNLMFLQNWLVEFEPSVKSKRRKENMNGNQ